MKPCFVDTSVLVSIAFGEPDGPEYAAGLQAFDPILCASLLEGEFLSALRREGVSDDGGLLDGLTWILPDRRLSPELERVLTAGYVRGAELWHLANALYVAEDPSELAFFTADGQQREIAERLGFALPM